MPKNHPNYPVNQCDNAGQFLEVLLGDEGGDHEPAPQDGSSTKGRITKGRITKGRTTKGRTIIR